MCHLTPRLRTTVIKICEQDVIQAIAWCDAAVDGDILQIAADKYEIKDRKVWAGIFDIASNIASYNNKNCVGSWYAVAF